MQLDFLLLLLNKASGALYSTSISDTKLPAFKASEAFSGRRCYYTFSSYYDKNLNFQASLDLVRKKSYAHYFLNLSLIYHILLLKWRYCTNFFSKLCMYWTLLSALLIHLCGCVSVCSERAFSCKSRANGKRNTFQFFIMCT